jgi:hypothetical protein
MQEELRDVTQIPRETTTMYNLNNDVSNGTDRRIFIEAKEQLL